MLIEEALFFRQFKFHRQKLVLHRASMQYYADFLREQGYTVYYVEAHEKAADIRHAGALLTKEQIGKVRFCEPADDWLSRRLCRMLEKQGIAAEVFTTPAFLNTPVEAEAYFSRRKSYFQTDFYIAQRKQRGILLTADGGPVGGRWSYDADNREKFPKGEVVPVLPFPRENQYVKEARAYVAKHFNKNYGSIEPPFKNDDSFYPVTHAEAAEWLKHFLEERFKKFGIYEDAIVAQEKVLYHSVLSPLLNTGLLVPQQIVDEALQYARRHKIPVNSTEGFIRQIIGWREYIRIVYEREGRKQRTKNYWGFTRRIPAAFYTGQTGIDPVDVTIGKLNETAYTHHIERLMILGNFMLLCEFDPNEVYEWFMTMFIDAYDWVMVPNIYGMTQFADGGIMMTKPYISGSNYIKKMSNYKNGEWQATWDALFWRFMSVHRDFFGQNPRLGLLLKTWDKMPSARRKEHLDTAEKFLQTLDK